MRVGGEALYCLMVCSLKFEICRPVGGAGRMQARHSHSLYLKINPIQSHKKLHHISKNNGTFCTYPRALSMEQIIEIHS